MWSSVKTDGVVLSVTAHREHDRRYTVLTPEGKLECVGKGAQRPKAKLASHLEPCAVLSLELVRGNGGSTVIGVERRQAFSRVAKNLAHRVLALTSLGILDRAVRPDAADRALYDDVLEWLGFLEKAETMSPTRSTFVLGAFLLRGMRHLGYGVSLDSCVSCEEAIVPLSYRWHGLKGGVVCSSCVQNARHEWIEAASLSEEALQLLRLSRDLPYDRLTDVHLKGDDVASAAACIHDLLLLHVPGYAPVPFWNGSLATA